jgi:hypothetical protein
MNEEMNWELEMNVWMKEKINAKKKYEEIKVMNEYMN